MRAWLGLLLLVSWAHGAEEWVFLKDGTVGLRDDSDQPANVRLADQTKVTFKPEDVLFRRTRAQIDQAVRKIVADLEQDKDRPTHLKELAVLRASAAPQLLQCLAQPEPQTRLAALNALQYGWSPQALAPVLEALKEPEPAMRDMAFRALTRNVPEIELAGKLLPLADADDLNLAALVFELVDKYHPDESLKRIKRLLSDEACCVAAATRLSHYLSADLTAPTLRLLDDARPFIRRAAVVGLIAQLADGEDARVKVRGLLAEEKGDLREIAAEYFTWNGKAGDLAALNEALDAEKDLYARAALAAAVKAVQRRTQVFAEKPELAKELNRLRETYALEPSFVYNVHEHEAKLAFRDRAYRLQEILGASVRVAQDGGKYLDDAAIPVAEKWVTPVRDYYDPGRVSYGYSVTKDFTAFVGSVHIGDDAGWNHELRTVVAIAPGIVRSVQHIFSWGFILVIEHKDANGEPYCSLYAHLSPMLHVKPGDRVEGGQKIASIGRNHTVDNGGYHAHVHVGLHHGAYDEGSWVCGYIGFQRWQDGMHTWVDPQKFLKEHGAP